MKKLVLLISILWTFDIVCQNSFDLSQVKITKTKKIKLKTPTITSAVTYTTTDYSFTFGRQQIDSFISDLKKYPNYNSFKFDSLKKATLTNLNDTIIFNRFADNFNIVLVERFIWSLASTGKAVIQDKSKKYITRATVYKWDKFFEGCTHSGYAIYINGKYFLDETIAYGRRLN